MSKNIQNKAKPVKDELSEQDLNKASGGTEIGGFNPTPLLGHDTNGVPYPKTLPGGNNNPLNR